MRRRRSGHARAAHAIVAAARADVHMAVPFYCLVGFSLEAVLKAAFLHLGGDMKVAKRDIGHDLEKAFASAQSCGFQPGNKDLEWLTTTLSDVHRNHSFRYLMGEGELRVADEGHCLRIVDDLIVQVGKLLHPEHERARWIELLEKYETRHD